MTDDRFTIKDYYNLPANDVIDIINEQKETIQNTKELILTVLQIAEQNGVITKHEIKQIINE